MPTLKVVSSDVAPDKNLDCPPFRDEYSFRYWHAQGNVPTARLDGRTEWASVCHLRNIPARTVEACPHDMQGVIELERLHYAITSRTFYDSSATPYTHYVSLIPSPVVDWFSRCSLSEVHTQIACYLALRIVLGGTRELILRDTHYIYHDKITEHTAAMSCSFPQPDEDNHNYEEHAWRCQQQLLKQYASQLPPWLRPKQEEEEVEIETTEDPQEFWLPRCEHEMPWQRPNNRWDDLGIVAYGLFDSDEEGIDVVLSEDQVYRQKQQPAPRPDDYSYRGDKLQRCESCPNAFEHLLYARHAKDAWAVPWSGKSPGKVYLIQDSQGRVKIGWTDGDPATRLSALQTGNADVLQLLGAINGPRKLEKYLHTKYAGLKARDGRTEWFRLRPADVLDILGSGSR